MIAALLVIAVGLVLALVLPGMWCLLALPFIPVSAWLMFGMDSR